MKNDNDSFQTYSLADRAKNKGGFASTPFGVIAEEKEMLNCKIDEVNQFLGDLDKNLKLTNGNPNTIEVSFCH